MDRTKFVEIYDKLCVVLSNYENDVFDAEEFYVSVVEIVNRMAEVIN